MTMQASGTDGFTFPDNTTQKTAFAPGMRNKIINGAMMIDQRNAGAAITSAGNVFTLDRFLIQGSVTGKFNVQQNQGSVTPPAGFTNYLGATSNSAYSITSGDYFIIRQPIEGLNCSDLNWGTASAKTVTLSFYVYSSLTGTFSGHLTNASSARWYPFTYSVSAANTWTYITITIAGDTTGTWLTNNGTGIYVGWSLGTGSSNQATANTWTASTGIAATGSVNVVATNGATFYITGVQLEKGASATPFENRLYGTELALCQRYLPCFNASATSAVFGTTINYSSTGSSCILNFGVQTRVPPTGISVTGTIASSIPAVGTYNLTLTFSSASVNAAVITGAGTAMGTGPGWLIANTSSATQIQFTGCEL